MALGKSYFDFSKFAHQVHLALNLRTHYDYTG